MLMVVIQLVYVRDVLGDRDIDTGPGAEQNADEPAEREEDLGQQPADVNL
jgi:hypothetical protein